MSLRGRWTRTGAALRIARRQAAKSRGSSALIVALIALPITVLSAAAIIVSSTAGTLEQRVDAQLGEMSAHVQIVAPPGSGIEQTPGESGWSSSNEPTTSAEPLREPTSALPPGTKALPITAGTVTTPTSTGRATLAAVFGEAWHPAFTGHFTVTQGKVPTHPDEAMVTASALDRLGIRLGDSLRLIDPAATITVTGVIDATGYPDAREMLFLPESVEGTAEALRGGATTWYLPDYEPTWDEIEALNAQGIVAYSRTLALNGNGAGGFPVGAYLLILTVGAAFAGYLVVLLSGAAFAVGTRRQHRMLATVAAIGATRGGIRAIVTLQGAVLGLCGGLLGAALGTAAAAAFIPLTDDGSGTMFWGFTMDWAVLTGLVVFATIMGMVSAAIPARSAAQIDVIETLRGGRKPTVLTVRRPVWGSVLLLVGVGIAVASVAGLLGAESMEASDLKTHIQTALRFALVVGPIISQLGVFLAGAWLLHVISRGLSRLGLSARLASRDAAANASRSVPAFAVITAAVFAAVFAVGFVAVKSADDERRYPYSAAVGTLIATPSHGTHPSEADFDTAIASVTDSGAEHVARVGLQLRGEFDVPASDIGRKLAVPLRAPSGRCDQDEWADSAACTSSSFESDDIAVVAAEDLELVLGAGISDDLRSAYREGAAIVRDPLVLGDDAVTLAFRELTGEPSLPLWIDNDTGKGLAKTELDARFVASANPLPWRVLLAPATADRLGIAVTHTVILGGYAEHPGSEILDALRETPTFSTNGMFDLRVENGPPLDAQLFYIGILIAVAVLVLGSSAISLGLARIDGRADTATLTAIGGERRMLRRLAFWQALVLSGVGILFGSLAGLVSIFGVIAQDATFRYEDMPWLLLAALVVGLPLLIGAAAYMTARLPRDLARRSIVA